MWTIPLKSDKIYEIRLRCAARRKINFAASVLCSIIITGLPGCYKSLAVFYTVLSLRQGGQEWYILQGIPTAISSASSRASCAGWAKRTPWWCWEISALCGTAAPQSASGWTGCASAPTRFCFWTAVTKTTTCWHSTRRRSCSAAGCRALAAMCTMCAGAVCWSWRARPISASAARKVRIRTTGSRA